MYALSGFIVGFLAWFFLRYVATCLYTVNQNERAVKTRFGRAERIGDRTTADTPLMDSLNEQERERYVYPQVRVIGPGGPYFKWPWEKIHKVNIATQTVNMAYDPDTPDANAGGTMLDAVTKDQLNTGLTGDIRYRVSEQNLYAYLFGVKNPVAHVMGYFVSILRERIANFEAPEPSLIVAPGQLESAASLPEMPAAPSGMSIVAGVSINDLRKNLRDINEHMDSECASAPARYGIMLEASLITGIDPPHEVESALAAINTAHNQVFSDVSLAHAAADQKIVQSKRAVEIETLKAEAEVEPLKWLAAQLTQLKQAGPNALPSYLRNVRLALFEKARNVILEVKKP